MKNILLLIILLFSIKQINAQCPTVTAIPSQTICAGQTATLTTSGMTTWTWTPALNNSLPTVTVNPIATVVYTVTGSCKEGVKNVKKAIIVMLSVDPTFTMNANTPVNICGNTTATLTASGANSYTWMPITNLTGANTAAPIATNLTNGLHTYTVTGTKGTCTDTKILTVNLIPSLTLSTGTNSVGTTTLIIASGGTGNYTWEPNKGLSSYTAASITVSPNPPITTTTYIVKSGVCSETITVKDKMTELNETIQNEAKEELGYKEDEAASIIGNINTAETEYNNARNGTGKIKKKWFKKCYTRHLKSKIEKLKKRANKLLTSNQKTSGNNNNIDSALYREIEISNYTIPNKKYLIGVDSVEIKFNVEGTKITLIYSSFHQMSADTMPRKQRTTPFILGTGVLDYMTQGDSIGFVRPIIVTHLNVLYPITKPISPNIDSIAHSIQRSLSPYIDTLRHRFPRGVLKAINAVDLFQVRVDNKIESYYNSNKHDDGSILNNKRKYHNIDTVASYIALVDSALRVQRKNLTILGAELDNMKKTKQTLIDNKTSSADINKIDTTTLIQNKIAAAILSLKHYISDSTKMATMLVGRHEDIGFNLSYFQSIPSLADDNQKNYSAYHLNLTLPINRFAGKIKQPVNNVTWFFFKNIEAAVCGVFNSKGLYAGLLDSAQAGGTKKTYVNLLDLRQNAFLTATANINVLTMNHKYYTLYLDGMLSFSKTNLHDKADTLYAKNFYQYGVNLTGRSKFKGPFNIKASLQFFWIDPVSNSLSLLNTQYKKLPYESNLPLSLPNIQAQPYVSYNVTLQYKMPGTSNSVNSSSASTVSGTAPAFFYASFGYSTAFMLGPRHLRNYDNNYFMLQIGYSIDIKTVLNALKAIAGNNTFVSSNSGASGTPKAQN